ncbi:hypothetical protein [Streptomyces sp. NPDC058755]|uniref:hypothetical protein n=1 Tax=Streptomyces sp. NPDC058755 TaxID=3346624 RepID=UPI0036B79A7E
MRRAPGQADAFAVATALDYRYLGTPDGRLGLWEPQHVKEYLLDWAPRTVTMLPDEQLPDAPGALLLRFLHAAHLADPRGPAWTRSSPRWTRPPAPTGRRWPTAPASDPPSSG